MIHYFRFSQYLPGIRRVYPLCVFLFILMAAGASSGRADPVSLETARVVAQNKVRHHLALYGTWNGSTAPFVDEGRPIDHEGLTVAYNFPVNPSGHVLVAVDDAFSPVLLYSATSAFDPERRTDPNSVESWILPELHHNTRAIGDLRRAAGGSLRMLDLTEAQAKITTAWEFLTSGRTAADATACLDGFQRDLTRAATKGPLLTTAWGQADPYNLMTPENSCTPGLSTDHTLTGCVATAWAQLARYWRWPNQGLGSHSYSWNSQTLSVDFSTATYDWDNMPGTLTALSTQEQKDAVSLLMYHMGVAAEMDYDCNSSGSGAWADDALDTYFNYKSSMNWLARSNYSASMWFSLFKVEFDADPPRPVVLSIFDTWGGGHEVVADGYQNDGTNLIHLNMGWSGSADAFYNITTNFSAGGYTWEADAQYIVTHIEPNNNPPVVEAGDNQTAEEGAVVQLSGSAIDPEGNGIAGYQWTQLVGDTVTISGSTSTAATFTTPQVHAQTMLVFQLRADDVNRAYGVDTVTISVNNTDGSTAPPTNTSRSDSGGSSGGCFVTALF